MRVFVAFDIEDRNLITEIKKIQDYLIERGVRGTFPKEGQYHITLKFLGETPDYKIEMIKTQLKTIKFNPFKITLDGIDGFPRLKSPRVVVIKILHNDVLKNIYEDIEKRLSVIGYQKERRPFKPHLTIARVKKPWSWKRYLEEKLSKITLDMEIQLTCLKLKSSILTSSGPIYRDIEVYCKNE